MQFSGKKEVRQGWIKEASEKYSIGKLTQARKSFFLRATGWLAVDACCLAVIETGVDHLPKHTGHPLEIAGRAVEYGVLLFSTYRFSINNHLALGVGLAKELQVQRIEDDINFLIDRDVPEVDGEDYRD